jgi:hypothetical protein
VCFEKTAGTLDQGRGAANPHQPTYGDDAGAVATHAGSRLSSVRSDAVAFPTPGGFWRCRSTVGSSSPRSPRPRLR